MTLINPMRTQLMNISTIETSIGKSLEKPAIFFGHANGYISLFQGIQSEFLFLSSLK